MEIIRTEIEGLVVLKPTVYEDDRGVFFETYKDYILNSALGKKVDFVQENQSFSYKNVFRGFHFQTGAFAQAKLIRVAQGRVLDVVIDLRSKSDTYGKVHSELVDDVNRKQVFVPRGFAHGFVTLSDTAIFQYKCDNYYSKEFEGGINPLSVSMPWLSQFGIKSDELIINKRDKTFPDLNLLAGFNNVFQS